MSELDITITGADAIAQRLGRLQAQAGAAQAQGVRALGEKYLLTLQDETPRGRGENPGGLLAAYHTEESATSGGAHYRITNTSPVLRYVLNGRGPITAHGRALRFVIDGQVFFRKSVGPAAANPFPDRARAKMQSAIDRAKEEIAGLIVREYYGA